MVVEMSNFPCEKTTDDAELMTLVFCLTPVTVSYPCRVTVLVSDQMPSYSD